MNVCLISREFPPETGWGGIATYNWELAHGLVELGHHVDVISICVRRQVGSRTIAENLRVHRVPACVSSHRLSQAICGRLRASSLLRGQRFTIDALLWALGAGLALRRLSQAVPFDVVECPEILAEGLLVKPLTHLPLAVKLHTPFELQWTLNGFAPTPDTRRATALERRTLRRADRVTSCSAALVDLLRENWPGMPPVEVVPNPVDHHTFTPKLGQFDRRELIIGYFGRLERRKGVDVLIQAFRQVAAEVPTAQLWMVGADTRIPDDEHGRSWGDKIRQDTVTSGIDGRVRLVGKVDRSDLPDLYHQCDVCVVPSRRFENFPYTCLEAMACGLPVVASACGGLPEMVENGRSGILVKPGDAGALSGALVELLRSTDRRVSLGRAARRRVERSFTRQKVTSLTAQLYGRVVE